MDAEEDGGWVHGWEEEEEESEDSGGVNPF